MNILVFSLMNRQKLYNKNKIDKQDIFCMAIVNEKKDIIFSLTKELDEFSSTLELIKNYNPKISITYNLFEKECFLSYLNESVDGSIIYDALCIYDILRDSRKELREFNTINYSQILRAYDIEEFENKNEFDYILSLVNLYYAYKNNEFFNIESLRDSKFKSVPLTKTKKLSKVASYSIYIDFEFDIEDRQKAEIISIGAVVTDDSIHEIDSFYSLISTVNKKNLSKLCMDITHLSQQEIDNADNLKKVMNKFYSWISKYLKNCVIYNWGNFDLVALSKILKSNGLAIIYNRIFKDMCDIQVEISNDLRINNEIVSKCLGLEKMKEIYALYGEVKHNALDDARDLMKVSHAYCNFSYNEYVLRKMYKEKIRKTFLWNYNFENKDYFVSYDIVCFIKSLKADIPIDQIKKKYKSVNFKLIKDIPLQLVITFNSNEDSLEYIINLDSLQKEIVKSFVKIELPDIIEQKIIF